MSHGLCNYCGGTGQIGSGYCPHCSGQRYRYEEDKSTSSYSSRFTTHKNDKQTKTPNLFDLLFKEEKKVEPEPEPTFFDLLFGTKKPAAKPEPQTGCFPLETLIDTINGKKALADISTGDWVASLAPNKEVEYQQVIKVIDYPSRTLNRVQTAYHDFYVTGSHSLMTASGLKTVTQLQVGDQVLYYDENRQIKSTMISSNKVTSKTAPVRNLYVKEQFSFIASGVVAHSFTHFRRARKLYYNYVSEGFIKRLKYT